MRICLAIAAFVPAIALAAASATTAPAGAQTGPSLLDPRERLVRPDVSGVGRVRFLTTLDYPPFSFADASGRLAGYNVDLARAICIELGIIDRCEIQTLDWNEIGPAIAAGQGEAVIAGIAISAETRRTYDFSRTYFTFPARFVARKPDADSLRPDDGLSGVRIGIVDGSAHADMLARWFPSAIPVPFQSPEALNDAVREGEVAAAFGDALTLSFWIASPNAAGCCAFVGGPYLSDAYLGAGLAIAFRKGDGLLVQATDHALRELQADGTLAELYRRYFPVDLFGD